MSPIEIFLYGAAGSVAVEIMNIYQLFVAECGVMPPRYKKFWFWVIRALVTLIAGGLALCYKIDTPLLAANVGAAVPLIIQSLAQGIKQPAIE